MYSNYLIRFFFFRQATIQLWQATLSVLDDTLSFSIYSISCVLSVPRSPKYRKISWYQDQRQTNSTVMRGGGLLARWLLIRTRTYLNFNKKIELFFVLEVGRRFKTVSKSFYNWCQHFSLLILFSLIEVFWSLVPLPFFPFNHVLFLEFLSFPNTNLTNNASVFPYLPPCSCLLEGTPFLTFNDALVMSFDKLWNKGVRSRNLWFCVDFVWKSTFFQIKSGSKGAALSNIFKFNFSFRYRFRLHFFYWLFLVSGSQIWNSTRWNFLGLTFMYPLLTSRARSMREHEEHAWAFKEHACHRRGHSRSQSPRPPRPAVGRREALGASIWK